jgi:hypothetical protein
LGARCGASRKGSRIGCGPSSECRDPAHRPMLTRRAVKKLIQVNRMEPTAGARTIPLTTAL